MLLCLELVSIFPCNFASINVLFFSSSSSSLVYAEFQRLDFFLIVTEELCNANASFCGAFTLQDCCNVSSLQRACCVSTLLPIEPEYNSNPFNIAKYSSKGPTADSRIKPDLVAPGGLMTAPRANPQQSPLPAGADPHADQLLSGSGTSFAAPLVAGAAALVRQYFVDGFYPSGIRKVKKNRPIFFVPL